MSAFLFRSSAESIKSLSDDDLREKQDRLESWLANVAWDALKQCTFDFDLAYGQAANFEMIKEEMELRSEGRGSEPLLTGMVPGYNPGKMGSSK